MMYRVQEAGHTVKSDVVGSDVVVINTCGFIDSAKSEAIDYILQTAALKAEGLVGKILVTGCLSQRYQGTFWKEMPEVDGILGTGSYTEIVPAIEKLLNGEQVVDFGSIDAPEVETGRIMTTADTTPLSKSPRAATTTAPTASFPPFGANTAAARWTTCFTKPGCWRTAA